MTSREEAAVPPIILPSSTSSTARLIPADTIQVRDPAVHLSEREDSAPASTTPCCRRSSSSLPDATCSSCSATWCPLLAPHLLSLTSSDQLFTGLLCEHLHAALKERRERKLEADKKEQEEEGCTSREVSCHIEGTEVGCLVSRDGYFEMGLDDSVQDSSLAPLPAGPAVPSSDPCDEEGPEENVNNVLWCYCVKVDEEQVEQSVVCVVLMDRLLCLLRLSDDNLDADKDRSPSAEVVLSGLEVDLLLPFSQLLLSPHAELPASCLAFGLQNGTARYYLFSEAQELQRTGAELKRLMQVTEVAETLQILPRSLLNSWELEECQGAQGGYLTLLLPSFPSSTSHQPLSDVLPNTEELPSLLFLTHRHLWVLKMEIRDLAEREKSDTGLLRDWRRLVRVALGSVVLHPNQKSPKAGKATGGKSCLHPKHHHRLNHTVELLLGGGRQLLLFPLAQDKSSFLGELSRRTVALEGLKTVALPLPCRCWPRQEEATKGHNRNADQCCCTSSRRSHSTSSSSRLRLEENQPSPHLAPGLSPGLKFLAGLDGEQLLTCFHRHIALSEVEELRQILWLSAVLYTAPEAELACCLLLSTDAVYVLLEDSAAARQCLPETDVSTSPDPNVWLCCCLTIRLADLLSVNVGLFDQYFRLVGRSAEHIVCCLSRDSYGTGVFLQELMAALSLQQKIPAPEPSEQDFYSQFANTSTGKMQNYELVHSSRVKFVYPSEEEMGDLTFIVAERKTAASASPSSSRSFNVLLYLLVFQVQIANGQASDRSPVLQPRTLILTSTDVFLLDEDYVSYPLPDFAKEPPSRERYRLREARRIRDLDRVLLGYQTYPQALTLVFDDLPGPDLLCRLTLDHFGAEGEEAPPPPPPCGGAEGEVQWCVFVPGADSRERLISLLARQWEALCSRELPVELTG